MTSEKPPQWHRHPYEIQFLLLLDLALGAFSMPYKPVATDIWALILFGSSTLAWHRKFCNWIFREVNLILHIVCLHDFMWTNVFLVIFPLKLRLELLGVFWIIWQILKVLALRKSSIWYVYCFLIIKHVVLIVLVIYTNVYCGKKQKLLLSTW